MCGAKLLWGVYAVRCLREGVRRWSPRERGRSIDGMRRSNGERCQGKFKGKEGVTVVRNGVYRPSLLRNSG